MLNKNKKRLNIKLKIRMKKTIKYRKNLFSYIFHQFLCIRSDVLIEHSFQELAGVGSGLSDLFGSSCCNYLTATVPAIRTEVNDIVGSLDNVQVMLNDNN